MEYGKLGSTGIEVSKLCIGCMSLRQGIMAIPLSLRWRTTTICCTVRMSGN